MIFLMDHTLQSQKKGEGQIVHKKKSFEAIKHSR